MCYDADMGMSSHVVGLQSSTAHHLRMVAAWRANAAAGVTQPPQLVQYFGGASVDESGFTVSVDVSVTAYNDPHHAREGFEVELAKVPAGITHLRFYNSW